MTNKIIEKIRKCLALSTSANEHEAASALRRVARACLVLTWQTPTCVSTRITDTDIPRCMPADK
ncbi:MAG: DUF2786 domain-containing protein [Zoogloeaceae bacterium]|nr:DUF2786 domain-containing protein [Zoogloeaceae bacterium]